MPRASQLKLSLLESPLDRMRVGLEEEDISGREVLAAKGCGVRFRIQVLSFRYEEGCSAEEYMQNRL